MGYKEREIINNVLLEGTKKGRLFRANSGMGYQGKDIQYLKIGKNEKGIIKKIINSLISFLKKINFKFKNLKILINVRIFHGMPAGTADVIGWESKKICDLLNKFDCEYFCTHYTSCGECPLNRKIAIFKGVEIKTGKQKLTPEQKNWRDQLIKDGGIYEKKTE